MRRSVWRIAAVAVVLLLLAELGVRALSSRLPEPVTWYHPVAQVKVEQMDRIAASGPTIEVALVGTSQMAIAGDPLAFTAQVHGHPVTYNAAVLAGYPPANHRFILEEVVPRLKPRTVVYGLSSEDLQRGTEAPYDDATATSPTVWGALDRWASAHSALVAHRHDLRDPTVWAAVLNGGTEGQLPFYRQSVIGPLGGWKGRVEHACRPGEGGVPDPVPDPAVFVPDPVREQMIWSTVDALKAQGITVVVAIMPFPDCHMAWFNARQADLDGRRALAAGAAAHGVASIDVADELHADDLFGDPGHVNQAGAERYTTLLAEGMNRLAP